MRLQDADEFFQSFFKSLSINKLARAAADGSDANNAVLRDAVPTVFPRFLCAPAAVVDNSDPVFSEPVSEYPHSIYVVFLKRLREILIGGEIRRDRSSEMPKHPQHKFAIVPDSSRPIELIIIDVPTDERVAEKGIILSCQRISV